MEAENTERLKNILTELEQLGDEIEEIESSETDINIQYELSECGSSLVDARVALRKALNY